MPHPFKKYLKDFSAPLESKVTQLNKAMWLLETTGSPDAADLVSQLDIEIKQYLGCKETYETLLAWKKEGSLEDPILMRALDVLISLIKPNLVPPHLREAISEKEADLAQLYAEFRPTMDGKELSENEIRDMLKTETSVSKRKEVWLASKEIGPVLAPKILELVQLRNEAARSVGYLNYFQMQLHLQEVNEDWLEKIFSQLIQQSEPAYEKICREIEEALMTQFSVPLSDLGPWAYSEPFGQEDPLNTEKLDQLVADVDLIQKSISFYDLMGMDLRGVLAKSDMFERKGKNQHAFCIHIDRKGDVRTLNNVQSSIRWLETILHEFGHAIYDLRVDATLPWVLRDPPHMMTTEAMALLMGRQAYRKSSLSHLVGAKKTDLKQLAEQGLQRRQLLFSRWVFVMTEFERALYQDPKQDLNALWWTLVEKYQKIRKPQGRENHPDWATKYHIGLAPVYYFSYLLGEVFASSIQEMIHRETGAMELTSKKAGDLLTERLFYPGNRMQWSALVKHTTGSPFKVDDWVKEFAGPVSHTAKDLL